MTRFVILPPAVNQIVGGDDEVMDPALVRFDPNRDYPIKVNDKVIAKGKVSRVEGQLVMDTDFDFEKYDAAGHISMNGVRMVKAALYGELVDIHAALREPRRLV